MNSYDGTTLTNYLPYRYEGEYDRLQKTIHLISQENKSLRKEVSFWEKMAVDWRNRFDGLTPTEVKVVEPGRRRVIVLYFLSLSFIAYLFSAGLL